MIYQAIYILIIPFIINLVSFSNSWAVVPAPPKIHSSSYLMIDFNSGEMLVQQDIDDRIEPASLTKMMTIYVVASELKSGSIKMDDKVLVSEKAWRMPGSRMFIEENKKVPVEDLLKGVIIQSGNDASLALAEYVSGSESVFVDIMNQHAKRLGMENTNYTNTTGLPDANHYTTTRDLAILSAALIGEFPEIYALHSIREFTYNNIKQHNRNSMLWLDDSVDGIKTGHTDSAGYCLVTSAIRGEMRLITVIVGTDGNKARTKATQSLLNYGFRYFETYKLYGAYETITTNRIWKGETDNIALGINQDLYITIPRGEYSRLDASVEVGSTIIAPVNKGDFYGNIKVMLGDKELINKKLIALQSVMEGGIFQRFKDEIKLLFE